MSEQEEDKRIAGLVKEHACLIEHIATLERSNQDLASTIANIGNAMRLERSSPVNAAMLSFELAKLPEGRISADEIRGLHAEHAEAVGRLLSIRSQLTPYGFKF
jgi:hypothetical protein